MAGSVEKHGGRQSRRGKMMMQGQGSVGSRKGMIGARRSKMHDRSRLSDQ
ncbi:hypothetical protein FOPG_04333 [Fusarium oxysporum f. sp. conglutinans race 2 54008]|uniref:Uncharacterized protein n=1 Tax=Fusarium oxysporum f. sp. conglutinans race 2 54008 TaxID=1089457 RepID=X0I2G5_FUSOX|nr:hypothetical protein FOPG_04333 [Fusarium oxysporum f. sp. conglutinans race 2 54008]